MTIGQRRELLGQNNNIITISPIKQHTVKMNEVVHPRTDLCPLIDTLPTEIRIQIYEYILFENGSFFALDDEEGNSVPTLFPKLRAPPKRREPAQEDHDETKALSRGPRKGNIMSLLLTSKQM